MRFQVHFVNAFLATPSRPSGMSGRGAEEEGRREGRLHGGRERTSPAGSGRESPESRTLLSVTEPVFILPTTLPRRWVVVADDVLLGKLDDLTLPCRKNCPDKSDANSEAAFLFLRADQVQVWNT